VKPTDARLEKLLSRLNDLEQTDGEHRIEILRVRPFSRKFWLIVRLGDIEYPRLYGDTPATGFSRVELYRYLSRRVTELALQPRRMWVNRGGAYRVVAPLIGEEENRPSCMR
jgi:hypothetical protein